MAAGGLTVPSHRRKFRVAYVILALVLVGAGVTLGYLLQPQPAAAPQAAWSSWQPSIPGDAGVLDIADHVGSQYRLPDGQQLSRIKAGYPGATGTVDPSAPDDIRIPVTSIALASTNGSGQTSYTLLPGYPSMIEYQLCGDGAKCQIVAGNGGQSPATAAALRREVLELSLYTFHYVPDISEVLAVLPPAGKAGQSHAILVQDAGPIQELLSQPLAQTLPPGPTAPDTQKLIDAFTAPSFDYSYQQQFDGTYQMVLSLPK
ncbi:MAG TPA: hypothetical protein VFQ71_12080 [Gaiellales bacterium]|jgi:hypothetical protein|nr:hypothetical protein [Gaiellales bacterium]